MHTVTEGTTAANLAMEQISPTSSTSFQVPHNRRTTQACDACKLRKVKCNGQDRCQQCSHLNLRCVYSAPKPRQKSLKRGQLIAKYKQSTTTSNGVSVAHALQEVRETSDSPGMSGQQTLPAIATLLPQSSSMEAVTTPIQDSQFFLNLIHDYEIDVYPVNPIITVAEVQSSINEMHVNDEARAFVYIFAAVTMNLTGCASGNHTHTSAQVDYWTQETLKVYQAPLLTSKITVRRIMIAEFLHICLLGQQHHDMAFYYLREAATMIQMLQIGSPDVMRSLPLSERARRQRLYFETFVHERYLAIQDRRTVILPPLPYMPEYDPALPIGIHEGFSQIIKLFLLVGDDFLSNWLGSQTDDTVVTSTWVEDKQKQIDAEPAGSDDAVSHLTDMQQADLVITKHWLRTLVWQIAMSKCLLSSAASKESMSLLFPVRLSKQLRALVTKIAQQSIGVHGLGIQQKLFELTDTIANVITTVPAATIEETAGRVDDFMFLVNFFFSFPRFETVLRDILQKKLETLQALFPYSANTPESLMSVGVSQNGDASEEDHWTSVTTTSPEATESRGYLRGEYNNHRSPESNIAPVQHQKPAKVWRDMTRKLSLAPSHMQNSYGGPQHFPPH